MKASIVLRRALATTALAGGLALGAMGAASAALVTDTINGPASSGTLDNGVSWSSSTNFNADGVTGISSAPGLGKVSSTLSLSGNPTSVEYSISGLAMPAPDLGFGGECVTVPAGSRLVSLNANHSYDAGTRELCGTGEDGNSPLSRTEFIIDNPGSSLTWTSTGDSVSPSYGPITQQIRNVRITADVEDVPVVSLPVLGAGAALAGAAFAPGLVKRARKNQDA